MVVEDGGVGKSELEPLPIPKFDLVGPTVDDDIRRAVWRYGADAVKAAVKRATRAKRGRKEEKDWPELRSISEADAKEWLAGRDPFKKRTNYSIAKEYAERNPGQSAVSTHDRIERKLRKKPHDREWFMLMTAMEMSRSKYPYAAYLRTLETITRIDPHKAYAMALENARSDLANYAAKTGGAPAANLTMEEIEKVSRNALLSFGKSTRLEGGKSASFLGGLFLDSSATGHRG